MTIKKTYKNKKSSLTHGEISNVFDFLSFDESPEEVALFILMFDSEVQSSDIDRLKDFIFSCCCELSEIFDFLIKHLDEIDWDVFIELFDEECFDKECDFYMTSLKSDHLKLRDKLMLLDEILKANICVERKSDYIREANLIFKNILTNPLSSKSEVRSSVSILNKVKKTNPLFKNSSSILDSYYVDNPLWKELYDEEVEYREKLISNGVGVRASEAFRKKQYDKVYEILKKCTYDDLPVSLKRKLDISAKKLRG